MTLYMDQPFRWGVPLELRDGAGRTRYTLTGDAYTLRRSLNVTDLAGRGALLIRQVIPSLFPRYEIEVYGRPVGELVKDLSFSPARVCVETLGWEVTGTPETRSCAVRFGEETVAVSRPDPEQPGVMVFQSKDRATELAALGVMLAVRCVLSPRN